MNTEMLRAPQYGIHCPLPPATDNPASPAATRPPTPGERAALLDLRHLAAISAAERRRQAPTVWF